MSYNFYLSSITSLDFLHVYLQLQLHLQFHIILLWQNPYNFLYKTFRQISCFFLSPQMYHNFSHFSTSWLLSAIFFKFLNSLFKKKMLQHMCFSFVYVKSKRLELRLYWDSLEPPRRLAKYPASFFNWQRLVLWICLYAWENDGIISFDPLFFFFLQIIAASQFNQKD